METEITVAQARGLLLACACMRGVLFDPARGRALATNGHILVGLKLANIAGSDSVIVPRSLLEIASKGGKVTDVLTIETAREDGKAYRVVTIHRYAAGNRQTFNADEVPGSFPDCDRVIPDRVSGELAQFNPELAATLGKALRLVADVAKAAVPAIAHNGQGAGVMTIGSPDAIGVIMPCRIEPEPEAGAAFKRAARPEQVAA